MFNGAEDDINKQGYVFPLAYFHSNSPPSVMYRCLDEDYVRKVNEQMGVWINGWMDG